MGTPAISPQVWERAKEIFAVLSGLPAEQREHLLEESCGGNQPLRDVVESLLRGADNPSDFLDRPAIEYSAVLKPLAETPSLYPGERVADRFRIVRKIGSGGMGEVYEAEDLALDGTRVALKIILPSFGLDQRMESQFRQEVYLARRVTHANVCRIHEFFAHEGPGPQEAPIRVCFFSMELVQGRPLTTLIGSGAALSQREARGLLSQLVAGLAAAHSAGVVHGDFKPANVLLDEQSDPPRAVITDFGLARPAHNQPTVTGSGLAGGTLRYMAPELEEGDPSTRASDVFAFGVVAAELITGKAAPDPKQAREMLSVAPAGIRRVVAKCLSPRPEQRYPDAVVLLRAWQHATSASWSRHTRLGFLGVTAGAAAGYLLARRNSIPAQPSLAVLPFEVSSPSLTEIAGGLADSLITGLGGTGALRVIAPFSSMQHAVPRGDWVALARKLAVDMYLTGRLDQEAGALRLAAQLLHAATGREMWKSSFVHAPAALYQVREDITAAVLSQLGIKGQAPGGTAPQPAAYELYLRGRYYWNKRDPENLKRALDCFRQAVEIQPAYAEAWAGLSDSYHLLAGSLIPAQEATTRAKEAAATALKINPALADAHLSSAILSQRVDWDWPAAELGFREALKLAPGNARAHHWYAGLLSDRGYSVQAIDEIDIARRLDPLSFAVSTAAVMYRYVARRFEEAIQIGNQVLEVEPGYFRVYPFLGACHLELQRTAKALEYYEQGIKLAPKDPYMLAHLGYACFRTGQRARGLQTLEALLKRPVAPPPFYVALAYCGDSDRENALKWLARAFQMRDPSMTMLKVHPAFDPVRGDPAFQDLLRKMQLE